MPSSEWFNFITYQSNNNVYWTTIILKTFYSYFWFERQPIVIVFIDIWLMYFFKVTLIQHIKKWHWNWHKQPWGNTPLPERKTASFMTNNVPVWSKSYLSVHRLITEQILHWVSLKIKDVQYGREISNVSTHKATLQDQEAVMWHYVSSEMDMSSIKWQI